METCPVCDTGNLKPTTGPLDVLLVPRDWGGPLITVDTEYCVCENCNANIVTPEQAKRNDKKVKLARETK